MTRTSLTAIPPPHCREVRLHLFRVGPDDRFPALFNDPYPRRGMERVDLLGQQLLSPRLPPRYRHASPSSPHRLSQHLPTGLIDIGRTVLISCLLPIDTLCEIIAESPCIINRDRRKDRSRLGAPRSSSFGTSAFLPPGTWNREHGTFFSLASLTPTHPPAIVRTRVTSKVITSTAVHGDRGTAPCMRKDSIAGYRNRRTRLLRSAVQGKISFAAPTAT